MNGSVERAQRLGDDVAAELRRRRRAPAGCSVDDDGALWPAALTPWACRAHPRLILIGSARRNLDQLRELLLGQRRRRVLERDGVLHDGVEAHDPVRVHRGAAERSRRACAWPIATGYADEIGIGLERGRIVEYIQSMVSRYAFMKRSMTALRVLQRLRRW